MATANKLKKKKKSNQMLMPVRNDSTSNLGNTISGVVQNAAPIMRKKKKSAWLSEDWVLLLVKL